MKAISFLTIRATEQPAVDEALCAAIKGAFVAVAPANIVAVDSN